MPHHVDVLIVGAGISGIGTACRLRQEFPDRSLAILERRPRLGGTWDLFRYPGTRSDSDMFTMAFDFRPWRESTILADAGSIRDYLADTAQEYGLERFLTFGVKVTRAQWSTTESRWTVSVLEEATGVEDTYTSDFLVSCTGYYNYDAGYLPDFPGLAEYDGTVVHPQFWPEDLDHTDAKVVVIGSGATAVSVIPAMAPSTAHVTMLQRSPGYLFSMPVKDSIAVALDKVLPSETAYRLTRRRMIAFQRIVYAACRRWPKPMRRFLLSHVRRRVGPDADMRNFTPSYMPWDERLCAVSDRDFFDAISSGRASVVTDTIETFTSNGIRLTSGDEIEADIVVTATGLEVQMLGGYELYVDERRIDLHDQLIYKGVMVQDVPNMLWILGYTNASWTLKVDIATKYLCRLLRHLDERGLKVAVAHDTSNSSEGTSVFDSLNSGYANRARAVMPRQGLRAPWRMDMNYAQDTKVLLEDPIDDGILEVRGSHESLRAAT